MSNEQIEHEIMLVMGICAHDGLLSSQELDQIKSAYIKDLQNDIEFEGLIDRFFDTTATLEQLFGQVANVERALSVAEIAAAADGLDIRENLALLRCKNLVAAGRRE